MGVKPKRDKSGQVVPGVWVIDYWPQGRNGKRIIRQFGTVEEPRRESEALALHMELVRLARRKPINQVNPRVSELLADWKLAYKNSHEPTTFRDLEACLVYLVPFFGPLFLAEITPAIIEQYKAQRVTARRKIKKRTGEEAEAYATRQAEAPTISKRSINKELSYLSSFLQWCADPERNYCTNPPKVKLFPARQTKAAKPRPLHPDEVAAMLGHLEPHYRLLFLVYNDAGLRLSEALGKGKYLGLRAEDVDLKFGVIYVRGKGDKERIVPVTTRRLRTALKERLEEVKTGHLFINPKTKKPWYGIRKALIRAATAAGIERRVYHHLLRHNFGTYAVAAGMNLRSVQELLGHSTVRTTEIYTHVAPFLHAEAAKLSAFVESEEDSTAENGTPAEAQENSGPADSDG